MPVFAKLDKKMAEILFPLRQEALPRMKETISQFKELATKGEQQIQQLGEF